MPCAFSRRRKKSKVLSGNAGKWFYRNSSFSKVRFKLTFSVFRNLVYSIRFLTYKSLLLIVQQAMIDIASKNFISNLFVRHTSGDKRGNKRKKIQAVMICSDVRLHVEVRKIFSILLVNGYPRLCTSLRKQLPVS